MLAKLLANLEAGIEAPFRGQVPFLLIEVGTQDIRPGNHGPEAVAPYPPPGRRAETAGCCSQHTIAFSRKPLDPFLFPIVEVLGCEALERQHVSKAGGPRA